jgi:hypothetical protein
MTIYFSGALAQSHLYHKYYQRIVTKLEKMGHTILQDTTKVSLTDAINKTDQERIAYYQQVLDWIGQSDLVVLEVSFPSTLHIGHELSVAISKGRPVVALYHQGKEPSFFLGLEEEKIFWGEYTDFDLEEIVREGVQYATNQTETRYNLFLSPKHIAHLDAMAKETKMPKSTYLRQLIEDDIKRKS